MANYQNLGSDRRRLPTEASVPISDRVSHAPNATVASGAPRPRASLARQSLDDSVIAALHPIHVAATAEKVWQAVLVFLRPRVPDEFIELLLPGLTGPDAKDTLQQWDRLFPGYVRSRGVTISKNYLQSHPQARLYTFSEILETDPTAAIELEVENGEAPAPRSLEPLPKCQDFANLVFWSPRGQLRAMLSICRRKEHGPFTPRDYAILSALYWAVHSALERVARQQPERARLHVAEQFVAALPLATLFLGESGEVHFANHAAYDLCAMWNFGPQRAVSYNTRACFALPEAIRQVLTRLGSAARNDTTTPRSTTIAHPGVPGLRATVRREDMDEAGLASTCYVVSLAYVDSFLGADSATSPAAYPTLQLLSPAERRVALLAREGCSNKEIAQRLGRAASSVVWTLHTIYQKLGVKNRTQLARLLIGAT